MAAAFRNDYGAGIRDCGLPMIHESFTLDREKLRPASVDALLQAVMALPLDKRFAVQVEEVSANLPHNLMARVKIIVRALAKFNDLTYGEMNEIVHDRFYPKRLKTVAGIEYEVSCPSNKLEDKEARQIEADLYAFAGELNCPIPQPQERG